MIVGWKGQTWGTWGSSTTVTKAPGLEDVIRNAANIAGGFDGAVKAPSFRGAGGFVVEVVVSPTGSMSTELDAIRAVTWGPSDRMTEDPFTFTIGDEDQRTVYARVTNRQIPTDLTTADRLVGATLQIAYEATDPMLYAAAVSTAIEQDDTVDITGGWAPSQRWRWIVHGPAHNPRLTLETSGFADQILRFVGDVNEGQNLLVESTPDSLITTVGGFNRYDDFDGGNTNIRPDFFQVLDGQTVTYTAGVGAGDGSFRYEPAVP